MSASAAAQPVDAGAQPVGTVGLVGRPSTGKSTLVNHICGHTVSIVSPVPQTTRTRVRGIYTSSAGQLILLDTPGLHDSERKMNLVLRQLAVSVADEVDVLLLLFDATRRLGDEDRRVLALGASFSGPVVVAINKIDLLSEPDAALAAVPAALAAAAAAAGMQPPLLVSASVGTGVQELIAALLERSPTGQLLYPDDMYTDQPPDFRVAEIIRGQAIARTHDELPHALYVDVLDLEPRGDSLWARATIYVERPSQVGIVVGRGGAGIGQIRAGAEQQLAEIFGRRVRVELRVKVRKNWRQDDALLNNLQSFR